VSRTQRRNDDEYHGRFHRTRKDSERAPEIPGRDMMSDPDDLILDDDDDDFELDQEELAAIEDGCEDDLDEDDD